MASSLPRPYLCVAMLSLLYFLLMAGTFNSLGVVLPLMVADLHLNWAQAGLGFTLLGVACGLSSLLPAVMIRKSGVSLTLATGAALLLSGFACLALAGGPMAYDIGTILLGVAFCFAGTVPGVHVISALFARPARMLGIYFATGGLGSVSGPLLFYMSDKLLAGWRPFWIMAAGSALVIGSMAALVTRTMPVTTAEHTATPDQGWRVKQALATPQLWIIIASYSVSLLVNTTMHSFAVQHLSEHGISLGKAATLISAAALVGAIASSAGGMLGEKLGARGLTILSMVAMTLASVMLTQTPTTPGLVLFVISLGIGIGAGYVCSATLLLDYFGQKPNLELYSLMCMVSTIAALGPALGGIIRDHTGNFHLLFVSLAGIEAACLMIVLAMRRPGTDTDATRDELTT